MGERCCDRSKTPYKYNHLSDLIGNIMLGFSTLNTGFMTDGILTNNCSTNYPISL